jgi:23S rRNA pseudouridine1911/1915/1917 synthase
MTSGGKTLTLVVPARLSGKRADAVLPDLLPELTRSRIKKLIEEKNILVDGSPIKPSRKLGIGETVHVTIPAPAPLEAAPEDIPISIIYEDEYIAVIDKPAGITVHPGAGVPGGTLVNALLYHLGGLSGVGGKVRPGIVHRLDKNTSGVIVVAKDDASHNSLAAQFKSRTVEKRYLAIVEGVMKTDSGSISSRIGRHPVDRKKMSSKAPSGRESLTLWKVRKKLRGATLVEARPRTGRTHQIRVHFAEAGHPLLADDVYGGKGKKPPVISTAAEITVRHALHAWKLAFAHPRTGERMEFMSPIPEDMKKALNFLSEAGENNSLNELD